MNPMKKAWRAAIGVTAASAFVVCGMIATPAMAADQPTLTVATDPSFVPFEFLKPGTDEYTGYDIEIIHAIADEAGFKVNLRPMQFSGIIPALQAGSVDIAIAAITITDKRAKAVDFTQPYYDSGLKLAVAADNDDIKSTDDLKGKKVSTKIGSTSYDYLTNEVDGIKKVDPYPNTSAMYMAVISGNDDATLYDVPNIMYFIKTKGKGKLKAVGPLYEGQQYGLALPKNSKWLDKVNEAMTTIKKNGTFAKIYKKYFDQEPPSDLLGDS